MRFWVTVLVFVVLNVTAWVAYDAWQARALDLVKIESFSPGPDQVLRTWSLGSFAPSPANATGSNTTVERIACDPLRFRFALPMDTSADLERQPPGTILPPLAGTWKWENPRELTFQPEQPPLATAFVVTLDPSALRSEHGLRLRQAFSAAFRTTPFQVHDAGVFAEGENVYRINLMCSDVVLPAEAEAAVSVVEADGTRVPIRSFQVQGTRLTLTTESLDDRSRALGGPIPVRVTVKAGLSGRAGPLGLTSDRTFPLILDSSLRLERVRAEMADDDGGVVRLEFNRWVKPETLRQVLRIEPPVAFDYDSSAGVSSAVTLRGAFRPGQRYAVVIDAPPAGAVGTFPLTERMPVWLPDHAPRVWFPDGSGRLGTQGTRTLAYKAVNLRGATLRIWRLYDNNLLNWVTRPDQRNTWRVSALGRPLVDRRITISGEKNKIHHLRLDLERELPADARGDGVVLVQIEPQQTDRLAEPERSYWYGYDRGDAQVVVSLSDVALTCHRGTDGSTVWATSLSTAKPLADVRVRVFSSKQQLLGEALSGADGLARVVEQPLAKEELASVVIAETPSGGVAWLALESSAGLRDPFADTGGSQRGGGLSAFVHAERGVWRPGETAHLRAIVRDHGDHAPQPLPLRWSIRRPDWKVWREEVATTLASGDLLLDLALPDDAPTGQWQVSLTLPGDERVLGSLALQVEDFMPDRMVVGFSHSGPGLLAEVPGHLRTLLLEQGDLTLTTRADYLFGKPASGRTLKAWARLDPTTWQPAGEAWRGWTFSDASDCRKDLDHVAISGVRLELSPAVADAQGAGSWDLALAARISTAAKERALPWLLRSGGEVVEVGGRAVSGNAPVVVVHPVRSWLGARLMQDGNATVLDLRSASPVDQPQACTAIIQVRREEWNTVLERTNGIMCYRSQRDLVAVGAPVTLAVPLAGARWTLPAELLAGTYVIVVEAQETRQLLSLYHRPGAPAGWQESISRERPDRCEVTVRPAPRPAVVLPDGSVVPDALPSAPVVLDPLAPLTIGGEALVTIRAPFAGRALVTVCSDRVLSTQVLEMTGNAAEVRLPVTADWRPDVFICVAVIRPLAVSDQVRLHRAWGVVRARTDEASRRLMVEVQAPEQHLPGTVLPLSGVVRGADGNVVAGATVTLAAVDEGVLRLTSHRSPDPFAWLIRPRALGVQSWDVFDDLLPELPKPGGDSATGGDGDRAARMTVTTTRYQSPVSAKRVVPFAFWSGLLTSDAAGRIHADVPVPPGFNGRVRVMAVAAHGATAGSTERWSTVRGPVVLQTSWPRFAAPGDRFRVSATATNLSGAAGTLTTTLVLPDGGLLDVAAREQSQPLADGAEAPVSFEVSVGAQSGVAQVRIRTQLQVVDAAGVSSVHAVEDLVELPVRPASPRISVGGEAVVSAATPWEGALPGGFLPGSGTVELRIGPRPALAIQRGLDYLYRYPYGCTEQTTSACFPLVYLRDLGDQIAPGLFLAEGITRRLDNGINRLQMMETDGGLSMWPGQRSPWSWSTIYATHFLVEAKRAGHAVPPDFLRRMLDTCRRVDTYNAWTWAESQAYACYVLALAGQPAHALMQRLEEVLKNPTTEKEIGPSTRSWLSAAWLEAGRKDLASALLPQQLPDWRSDRRLDGDLASPIRDRAVLLATLIDVAPDHPQIPGLAQDLAKLAPWPSTQDTSFALLALGRYLRHVQRTPAPDAVFLQVDGAEVGTANAGPSLQWSGKSATAAQARITGGPDARAWVSWLVSGVPLTPPAEVIHGLRVSRRWSDERGQDLAGRALATGDLVRVDLLVTSDTAYRGVVMEDLLPAGLEIENARLATSAAGRPDGPAQSWRSEVRDDRLVVMGDLYRTDDGRWELRASYLARAVTPGTYVLPPLRAECMYDIAINGIAGAATVTVLPAK